MNFAAFCRHARLILYRLTDCFSARYALRNEEALVARHAGLGHWHHLLLALLFCFLPVATTVTCISQQLRLVHPALESSPVGT